MIRVRCKTNLDRFRLCDWPDFMVAVPRKGEYVRAADGKELCVVQVTHAIERAYSGPAEPIVYVELHAPPGLEALYMRRDDDR